MGIGSVTSGNSMSSIQMLTKASTDPKIKKTQNEIADAKQQMQKLSSAEELSLNEKANERKKLQKEISGLNAELERHQAALLKSQKKEIMLAKLQGEQKPTKEDKAESNLQTKETALSQTDEKSLPENDRQAMQPGTVIVKNNDGTVIFKGEMKQDESSDISAGIKPANEAENKEEAKTKEEVIAESKPKNGDNNIITDTGLSRKDIHTMVSADFSMQQANRQGTIIARTRDGIAVLKGEINLDEMRGSNTEKKQTELEKLEKKEEQATAFQFSILQEANNTIKSAAGTNSMGINSNIQVNAADNAFINSLKLLQEDEQQAQQRFYVSFG